MPEKKTLARARQDKRAGKAASTQAGEFVRQEIHHIRAGKHGAKNTKQAIAIGLSEARRAGVKLPSRGGGTAASTGKRTKKVSAKRSRSAKRALERQPRAAASRRSLSRQAKAVAHSRPAAERSRAAKKAARTRKRERSRR